MGAPLAPMCAEAIPHSDALRALTPSKVLRLERTRILCGIPDNRLQGQSFGAPIIS